MSARWSTYVELTKPRLTGLAVLSSLVGYVMAAARPLELWPMLLALAGAALVGGGGNALNQWLERDADALMRRTMQRPLPTGRLTPEQALQFGLVSSCTGLALLALTGRNLPVVLGAFTLVSYVAWYTPLKRKTPLCTLVGALPGALPPLIGWAAARDTLSVDAWLLFGIVFLWQLPHFLSIAWMYRDDYARAGFKMLPVVEPDGFSTARHMVVYGLALLPVSLLPTIAGLTGRIYFLGAMLIGLWFLRVTCLAAMGRTPVLARRLFLASIGYLPVLLTLMLLDRTPI